MHTVCPTRSVGAIGSSRNGLVGVAQLVFILRGASGEMARLVDTEPPAKSPAARLDLSRIAIIGLDSDRGGRRPPPRRRILSVVEFLYPYSGAFFKRPIQSPVTIAPIATTPIATITTPPIVNRIQRGDRLDRRTDGPAIRWSRLQNWHTEKAKEQSHQRCY